MWEPTAKQRTCRDARMHYARTREYVILGTGAAAEETPARAVIGIISNRKIYRNNNNNNAILPAGTSREYQKRRARPPDCSVAFGDVGMDICHLLSSGRYDSCSYVILILSIEYVCSRPRCFFVQHVFSGKKSGNARSCQCS